jgi:hypothetical protein
MFEKIGATKIAECVVAGMFPIPRHLCVSNVSWSLLPYEADLIALTQSGYMIEVEIKISLSDLKREDGKAKWRSRAFGSLNPAPAPTSFTLAREPRTADWPKVSDER